MDKSYSLPFRSFQLDNKFKNLADQYIIIIMSITLKGIIIIKIDYTGRQEKLTKFNT